MPNWAEAFNQEQLTVSSTAIGFTSAKYFPTDGTRPANKAIVTVDPTNAIRWTMDGTTPTASVGHYLVGGTIEIDGYNNIKKFRMIRVSVDASVSATFLR